MVLSLVKVEPNRFLQTRYVVKQITYFCTLRLSISRHRWKKSVGLLNDQRRFSPEIKMHGMVVMKDENV